MKCFWFRLQHILFDGEIFDGEIFPIQQKIEKNIISYEIIKETLLDDDPIPNRNV